MLLRRLSRLTVLAAILCSAGFLRGASDRGAEGGQPVPAAADNSANSGKAPDGKSQRRLSPYRIGPGDVLAVDVWHEPEASIPTTAVGPDGNVSLPIVGQCAAAGLTPTELEAALTTKYAEYIRDPQVSVLVKEINSQKIYIIGEVKKEGPVRLDGPLNVLQALAQAGGVTDYAKRKKIYVLRMQESRQVRFPFDYDAVLHGQKIEQNILLESGDTVVVPR